MKIAYQGVPGAYSQQAIVQYYKEEVATQSCESFDEMFTQLREGKVTHAFVPVENTIAGSVIPNFDLMAKEEIQIIGEVLLPIKHQLLVPKGTPLSEITKALSHPVALAQCKVFLNKQRIKAETVFDTAGAAEMIAQNKNEGEAAIASALCKDIYDLDVVASDIQDTDNNTTRFFIIVKKENAQHIDDANKTSIVFSVKHKPGSLVQCLQRLEKHNINMTKLESRPIPQNPFEYIFFVDFLGGLQQENVQIMLKDLEAMTTNLKVLGSYKQAEKKK